MSFSFCLNKNEMLTLCGLSLIYQGLDLKQEGKLMKDSQRLIGAVVNYLERYDAPGASEFKKLAFSLMPVEDVAKSAIRRASENNMAAPAMTKSKPSPLQRKQPAHSVSRLSAITPNSEADLLHDQEIMRRATMPNVKVHSITGRHSNHSQSSLDSSDSSMPPREYRSSASQGSSASTHLKARTSSTPLKPLPNLDYLSLNITPSSSQVHSPILARASTSQGLTSSFAPNASPGTASTQQKMSSVTPDEWETLLSSLDGGISNIYDAVYGGPPPLLGDITPNTNNLNTTTGSTHPTGLSSSSVYGADVYSTDTWDLSPESWDVTALSMADFEPNNSHGPPQSVLSFSEDSLSSGDDIASSDFSGNGGGSGLLGSQGLNGVPLTGDNFLLDGLDGSFGI